MAPFPKKRRGKLYNIRSRPLKTVNRFIQAFSEEGRLSDAPHRRRPKATTEDEDPLIVAAVVENPFQSARQVREQLDVDASLAMVGRRLRSAGLRNSVAARKPVVTASNKKSRLQFAESHALWMADDLGRVIVSGSRREWPKLRERVGRGVKAQSRASASHGSAFPDADVMFQHDLAPVHTAKVVKEYIENRRIGMLSWPAKGADMNICENIWGYIKAAMVRKPVHPSTGDELWAAVRQWEDLRAHYDFVSALYAYCGCRLTALVI
ncbi:hypothetical protein HPB52_016494 [Rhipicephalus sanguineus]|uniref:Transposase Tc1-like domain-containing protein n=1 Tax=Rhipicephalus sanguineus TaxID=34632 RepID=A0A9D4PJ14_RHISA|nr:hypothetical protein HPB52_016494 [Rhipicephalus sanguineus]